MLGLEEEDVGSKWKVRLDLGREIDAAGEMLLRPGRPQVIAADSSTDVVCPSRRVVTRSPHGVCILQESIVPRAVGQYHTC